MIVQNGKTKNLICYILQLEKERDYYKKIAHAYKATKGKSLETCPQSCKNGLIRRLEIIKNFEEEN